MSVPRLRGTDRRDRLPSWRAARVHARTPVHARVAARAAVVCVAGRVAAIAAVSIRRARVDELTTVSRERPCIRASLRIWVHGSVGTSITGTGQERDRPAVQPCAYASRVLVAYVKRPFGRDSASADARATDQANYQVHPCRSHCSNALHVPLRAGGRMRSAAPSFKCRWLHCPAESRRPSRGFRGPFRGPRSTSGARHPT